MTTLAGTAVGDQLQGLSQDDLRTAIQEFTNNGRSGYNDPYHLGQALAAVRRRDRGQFDEYIEEKFQETWVEQGEDDAPYSDAPEEMSAGI
jgi:hypothetical protein